MFKNNRNLAIITLIAVVNALGYGIIIPILYAYSQKYGLTDFQNGLLFAIFSVCQFIATPIIGRLSDKYGRKPLLVVSLFGTALSFFVMAFAPGALFLFLARALDGITAGNASVASAVISDTTSIKDRAKGFGILGASFGFGMIFGPAISALTVGISDALPFIIAGIVSLLAVVITAIFLPETNQHIGEVTEGKLFDFGKLISATKDERVGTTFTMMLLFSFAFSIFIYVFQPFSLKVLNLAPSQISLLFTLFGVIGVTTQILLVDRISKKFGILKACSGSLLTATLCFLAFYFTQSLAVFIVIAIIFRLANSISQPLLPTILSKETDQKSQGTVMGLAASFSSIGQILGPIVGGALASIYIPSPFLAGFILVFLCFILSFRLTKNQIPESVS